MVGSEWHLEKEFLVPVWMSIWERQKQLVTRRLWIVVIPVAFVNFSYSATLKNFMNSIFYLYVDLYFFMIYYAYIIKCVPVVTILLIFIKLT